MLLLIWSALILMILQTFSGENKYKNILLINHIGSFIKITFYLFIKKNAWNDKNTFFETLSL